VCVCTKKWGFDLLEYLFWKVSSFPDRICDEQQNYLSSINKQLTPTILCTILPVPFQTAEMDTDLGTRCARCEFYSGGVRLIPSVV